MLPRPHSHHRAATSASGTATVSRGPIRGELLGPERLRSAHREIARASANVTFSEDRLLLERFERDSRALYASHRVIADAYVAHESLPGEAAWFYDNFHIVSETLREIRTDLPFGYYRRLPKLPRRTVRRPAASILAGIGTRRSHGQCPRRKHLARFIQNYQEVTPLAIGEFGPFPSCCGWFLWRISVDWRMELSRFAISECWPRHGSNGCGKDETVPDQLAQDLVDNAGHLIVSVSRDYELTESRANDWNNLKSLRTSAAFTSRIYCLANGSGKPPTK